VIVDVDGYWRPLTALIDRTIDAGFAGERTRSLFDVVDGPEALLAALAAAPEPRLPPVPERA
jgi:predicted Rossmann-fold nucleotide-binding protein